MSIHKYFSVLDANTTVNSYFSPCLFPGYAIANTTGTVAASQLKQTLSLGQDLAAYTTYEGYPAFAVTTRGDAYGVF